MEKAELDQDCKVALEHQKNLNVYHSNGIKKPYSRYCSKCGNGIDPITKMCTGCGKQYFKGNPWKVFGVVVLTLLLIGKNGVNLSIIDLLENV